MTFVSCGKGMPHYANLFDDGDGDSKPIPEVIVEEIFPDILEQEGCDILYPQAVGDIIAVISCESGESYLLYADGSFVEGDSSDIEFADEQNDDDRTDDNNEEDIACLENELIINGSFEEGHGLGTNQWGLFEYLPGWYANTIKRNAAIEVQNGPNIGGISASDGTAKVELDAHDKDGYSSSDVVVVQDIVTNSNELYILSFDYSARVANNKKTNRARVLWNGKKVANLNNNSVGWKSYSIQVKSISEIQRLEFIGKQDSDTVGGYIDNISLKKVCN
jgi:hypothetical protein